jgi:hypothetical protein
LVLEPAVRVGYPELLSVKKTLGEAAFGNSGYLANPYTYHRIGKNCRFEMHMFPWHVWGGLFYSIVDDVANGHEGDP